MGALKLTYQNPESLNLKVVYKNPELSKTAFREKETPCFGALSCYPGGSIMPGRNFNSPEYRFGFQGQEKDDEITGVTGSHTTATFWEYDTRIGRRWNLDPKPNASISYYACFSDNPILYSDPLGDTLRFGEGQGLGFKLKATASLALNYIFSPTARENIDELRKDDKIHEILDGRKKGIGSHVVPEDVFNYRSQKPILPESTVIGDPDLDDPKDIAEWNKYYKDKEAYEKLPYPSEHKTPESQGGGTGSKIYLDFSKKYKQDFTEKFGVRKAYIHVINSHEIQHGIENKRGMNIYYNDGTDRSELNPTITQNKTAEEFNRFRIRKFKTDLDQYNVLNR